MGLERGVGELWVMVMRCCSRCKGQGYWIARLEVYISCIYDRALDGRHGAWNGERKMSC